jgi:hypothetical protein
MQAFSMLHLNYFQNWALIVDAGNEAQRILLTVPFARQCVSKGDVYPWSQNLGKVPNIVSGIQQVFSVVVTGSFENPVIQK